MSYYHILDLLPGLFLFLIDVIQVEKFPSFDLEVCCVAFPGKKIMILILPIILTVNT